MVSRVHAYIALLDNMGHIYPYMQDSQGHIWDRRKFICMETRSFVPHIASAREQTLILPALLAQSLPKVSFQPYFPWPCNTTFYRNEMFMKCIQPGLVQALLLSLLWKYLHSTDFADLSLLASVEIVLIYIHWDSEDSFVKGKIQYVVFFMYIRWCRKS